MKPGELRRFTVADSASRKRWGMGDIFMVLDIIQPRSDFPKQVAFLIGGRIETHWSAQWIMNNSEVINEVL